MFHGNNQITKGVSSVLTTMKINCESYVTLCMGELCSKITENILQRINEK